MKVEDGTGFNDSDSYATVEAADAYFSARGVFDWDDAEDKAAALVRATTYLNTRYTGRWDGARTSNRKQALDWPRAGATDAEGNAIASNEIPTELKKATIESALQIVLGNLELVQEKPGKMIRDKLGPMETAFSETRDVGPGVLWDEYLDDLLDGLLVGIAGQSANVAFLSRA